MEGKEPVGPHPAALSFTVTVVKMDLNDHWKATRKNSVAVTERIACCILAVFLQR